MPMTELSMEWVVTLRKAIQFGSTFVRIGTAFLIGESYVFKR